MSAPVGSVHIRAVFDGKAFVPAEPLDLPVGTVLDGTAQPPPSQEEWHVFLDSVEGAWVGPDMEEPGELPFEREEPIF